MCEDETEYGDAAVTADQYAYLIRRLCEIFEVDKRDRGLYRRAVYTLGEDRVLTLLGMVYVYMKHETFREAFEGQLELALGEYDFNDK